MLQGTHTLLLYCFTACPCLVPLADWSSYLQSLHLLVMHEMFPLFGGGDRLPFAPLLSSGLQLVWF